MFIDVHAHLHVQEFDDDREEVIQRALDNGVRKIVNVGFDVEGNYRALALAKKYEFIYATFGIHPHLASEWNDEVGQKIYELAKKEPKVIALGEMGLDFYKNFQPREIQIKAFQGQLALAKELNLPVIIHCRDAFKDVFRILEDEKIERVLLHCFTGSLDIAKEAWRKGFSTSFTGIITYPSAQELRKVVASAPLEQLFFETDCPFLAPQKYRGKRNEPAFVEEIYTKTALLKNITHELLKEQIEKNFGLFVTH